MSRRFAVSFAAVYGVATHIIFAWAVIVMIAALYHGLNTAHGPFHGWIAFVADTVLLLQFPLLHSYLLTPRGRALMAKIAPGQLGKDLAPTTFVLVASLQLLAAFLFWSRSGYTIYEATGRTWWFFLALYLASWLFLVKALTDAGLGLQTGFIGWSSVVRGKRPEYGKFPTHGLFRFTRHPVYVGFALVMWTGPTITADGLFLAIGWTAYCLLGPLLKEKRYLGWYGEQYTRYRASVPYFLPKFKS